MNNTFKAIDEQGVQREAHILTKLEIEGIEYLVYTIDRDSENTNIFVSKISKDQLGNNQLEDITNPEEKQKVTELTKQLIKIPLE